MTQHNPRSRRARALRVAGVAVTIVVTLLAIPILIAKLFADASGQRR